MARVPRSPALGAAAGAAAALTGSVPQIAHAAAQECRVTEADILGPFYRFGAPFQTRLAAPDEAGDKLRLTGTVFSADCRTPVPDALIEVWQANNAGLYDTNTPGNFTEVSQFHLRGMLQTNETGQYEIETIVPGSVPGPGGRPQAPHLNLVIQARGMLLPSFTRCYFDDEADANAADPVLGLVAADRRATLLAMLESPDAEPQTYRFDIRFGGDAETVFFDL